MSGLDGGARIGTPRPPTVPAAMRRVSFNLQAIQTLQLFSTAPAPEAASDVCKGHFVAALLLCQCAAAAVR
jgi:hypothetical protein